MEANAKEIEPTNPVIEREIAEIQHAIAEEKQAAAGSGGRRALFKNGPQRFFHRTLLGIDGQFMQQLSGINLITYVSVAWNRDRRLMLIIYSTHQLSLSNRLGCRIVFRSYSPASMVSHIFSHH